MADLNEIEMKEIKSINEKGAVSQIITAVYTIEGKKKGVARLETVLFHQQKLIHSVGELTPSSR